MLRGGWFDAGLNYEFSLGSDEQPQLELHDMQASLSDLDILAPRNGPLLARLPTVALSGGDFDLQQRQLQFDRLQLADFDIRPVRYQDGGINFLSLFPAAETAPSPGVDSTTGTGATPWIFGITETAVEGWRIQLRDELPAHPVSVVLGLSARATNLSNRPNAAVNIDSEISVGSGGRLRAGGALTVLPALRYDGGFTLDDLALPVVQPYLENLANIHLDSGRLRAEGTVSYTPAQSGFNGSLALAELGITDSGENEPLFGIEGLQIEAIELQAGEQVSVDIGTIRLDRPYARVEIKADGSNNIARVLRADSTQPEAANATTATASAPLPPIRIDQVVLSAASADFSDDSLPLPFAVHMDALGGEVSAISSQSAEPARIALEGQVDEFGLATISGRLRPLDFASLTEIDLAFRNLSIPSLSPYMIKFAGRRIDEGNLDVDLSYRIQDQQLQGDNAMVMRNLVLGERVPNPDALDLPLGLAIALLKDRNGVIDLAVPVTGDLNNPQFSYGGIISRALANIIRNIVSSPFRFLAGLVGGGDDTDFGVVAFMPGRSDLLPPEREKLLKLGSALVERPQLQLELAGVYAGSEDREAMQQNVFDARVALALEAARQAANEARALAEAQRAVAESPDTIVVPAVPSATALRRQVLERFYRESATDAAAMVEVEALLEARREEFTVLTQPPQFDETAYLESLRRSLIALEAITQADLERLAAERQEAIVAALLSLDTTLSARLVTPPGASDVALQEERVPMELALSAL